MTTRKTVRSNKAVPHRLMPEIFTRRLSALAGCVLICVALVCAGWLLVSQHNPGLTIRFPFSQAQPTAQSTVDPLVAAGITLTSPAQGQTALLAQPQALLLANQMEPQAAAHSGSVSAEYVLFSYNGSHSTLAALHDVPAWFIHYSKVAAVGPDTQADPHATNPPHDCYLFLDANSGQELLALWD